MRILDEDSNNSFNRVVLYLTKFEASELRDSLNNIINNPEGSHEHIPSCDYKKELSICIYDDKNIGDFNKRSQELIKDDR